MHINMIRKANALQERGFSLVQLVIVLTIIALALAIVLPGREQGAPLEKRNNTLDQMQVIEDALVGFKAAYGRLPCPADATLPLTDANFGVEASNPGSCTGGAIQANLVDSATDIVGGAVPVSALQLSPEAALDGNLRRFTYYVDSKATSASSCVGLVNGSILIKDGTGGNTISQAMVALVGHGEDGYGAFPSNGSTLAGRINTGSGDPDEHNNASILDDTFAVDHDSDLIDKEMTSSFDDMVRYQTNCCVGAICTNPPYEGAEIAVAQQASPYVMFYTLESDDTFDKIADPATLPQSNRVNVAFSPGNNYLAAVGGIPGELIIYKLSGSTYVKIADPASMPGGTVGSLAWSPDETYLAIYRFNGGQVMIYKRSGDTFTPLAGQPNTNPADNTVVDAGIRFSPDGNYLAISHRQTPFVYIYKRSGDTFTKLANPASLPGATAADVCWSHDSIYLGVTDEVGMGATVTVYKRAGDTFTKLAGTPTRPATADPYFCSFSPSDAHLVLTSRFTTPPIRPIIAYRFYNDTLTAVSNFDLRDIPDVKRSAWSKDGQWLAVSVSVAPYVLIYEVDGDTDTFTQVATPFDINPASTSEGVDFRH